MRRTIYVKMICTVLAAMCLIAGLTRVIEIGLAAFEPNALSANIHCRNASCDLQYDPVALLGSRAGGEARTDPSAAAKLKARLAMPRVRTLMTLSKVVETLPVFMVYLSIAFVLRRFALRDPFGEESIRWLRRAAMAAGLLVLAKPIAASLWLTALQPALGGGERWRFSITGSEVPYDLLLVGIVWTVAWALGEGKRSHDELNRYV